jgi:hypothetical protein
VERLRDMNPVPGSPEAILIDAINASLPIEPTAFQQQRVLERVLDRQRARHGGAARFLRPVVALAILLVAGATAASTFGHGWLARGLRSLGAQAPIVAPETVPRRHLRAIAEPIAPTPPVAEAEEAVPSPELAPVAAHAPRLAARPHAVRTEDPSLVVDAIRALRTDRDPRRAGTLLAAYLRTYPHGALSEEALALSIEASAAQHDPRAATFADQYLREYPHGRFRRAAGQAIERRQP